MAKKTLADKLTPPPNKSVKQMSTAEIREYIRPIVPDLIKKAIELAESADNDSVRLGAIKTLLNKVIPDIKAMEVTGKDGEKLQALVVIKSDDNKTLPVADDSTGRQS